METIFIYIILFLSMVLPLVQIALSANYFKRFAFEYLDNRPVSWNPNYDRKILVFTIVFGLASILISKQIWQGKTEESLFLTVTYLCIIGVMFGLTYTILKLQKEEIKKLEIKKVDYISEKFFEYDPGTILNLSDYLLSTGKIKEDDIAESDFLAVFMGGKLKRKIIWTDKYNNSTTYVTLIILYKFILKEMYFDMQMVFEEINKNFLFEKREPQTGHPKVEELNKKSFEQSFRNLDFDRLVRYQEKAYKEYSEILK